MQDYLSVLISTEIYSSSFASVDCDLHPNSKLHQADLTVMAFVTVNRFSYCLILISKKITPRIGDKYKLPS